VSRVHANGRHGTMQFAAVHCLMSSILDSVTAQSRVDCQQRAFCCSSEARFVWMLRVVNVMIDQAVTWAAGACFRRFVMVYEKN
jgi:hypothetical protein